MSRAWTTRSSGSSGAYAPRIAVAYRQPAAWTQSLAEMGLCRLVAEAPAPPHPDQAGPALGSEAGLARQHGPHRSLNHHRRLGVSDPARRTVDAAGAPDRELPARGGGEGDEE